MLRPFDLRPARSISVTVPVIWMVTRVGRPEQAIKAAMVPHAVS